MILLDTDHFSESVGGQSALGSRLGERLKSCGEQYGTSIITYEEQLRGWLAKIHRHRDLKQRFRGYRMLRNVLESFEVWLVFDWDHAAEEVFADMRDRRIPGSTLDLMIASIAISNQAKLLSRNLKDFQRVPGLDVEDWLSENN